MDAMLRAQITDGCNTEQVHVMSLRMQRTHHRSIGTNDDGLVPSLNDCFFGCFGWIESHRIGLDVPDLDTETQGMDLTDGSVTGSVVVDILISESQCSSVFVGLDRIELDLVYQTQTPRPTGGMDGPGQMMEAPQAQLLILAIWWASLLAEGLAGV